MNIKVKSGAVFLVAVIFGLFAFGTHDANAASYCISNDCRPIPPPSQKKYVAPYNVFDTENKYCANKGKNCTPVWPISSYRKSIDSVGYCTKYKCVSPWLTTIELANIQKQTDGYSAWLEAVFFTQGEVTNISWGVEKAGESEKKCEERRVSFIRSKDVPCGWRNSSTSVERLDKDSQMYSAKFRNYYSKDPKKCDFRVTGPQGFPSEFGFCLTQTLPPPPVINYFTINGLPDIAFVPRGKRFTVAWNIFGATSISIEPLTLEGLAQQVDNAGNLDAGHWMNKALRQNWLVSTSWKNDIAKLTGGGEFGLSAQAHTRYRLTASNPGGKTVKDVIINVPRNSYGKWFRALPPQGIKYVLPDGTIDYAVKYLEEYYVTDTKRSYGVTNYVPPNAKDIGRFDFMDSKEYVKARDSVIRGDKINASGTRISSQEEFEKIFGPPPCLGGKTYDISDTETSGLFGPRYLTPTFWCSNENDGMCVDYGPDCDGVDLQAEWDKAPNGITFRCTLAGLKARIATCVGEHERKITYLTQGRYHSKAGISVIQQFFTTLLLAQLFGSNASNASVQSSNLPASMLNLRCPTCDIVKKEGFSPQGSLILGQGGVHQDANELMKRIGEKEARDVGVHSVRGLNFNAVALNKEPLSYNTSDWIMSACGADTACQDFAAANAYRPRTSW